MKDKAEAGDLPSCLLLMQSFFTLPSPGTMVVSPLMWASPTSLTTPCLHSPLEQVMCLLAIMHVFLLTRRDSTQGRFSLPRALPICTPSPSAHTHQYHSPILFFYLCPHLGVQRSAWHCHLHLYTLMCSPCIHVPSAVCSLRFLILPLACWHQSLFQASKSPCARQEDIFLIHPHYQQSAPRSQQPCQLLRNETIASIWWISWLSTLLIRQMNWKKKHSLFWTNDSLTSLLFKTWLASVSYFHF